MSSKKRTEEELFMQSPQASSPHDPDTAPGPLRIHKAPSPTASPPAASHHFPGPYFYPGPSSSPPNRPLPYPEDRAGGASSTGAPKPDSSGKPLPQSPGPETPDKEGLFIRPPQRGNEASRYNAAGSSAQGAASSSSSQPQYSLPPSIAIAGPTPTRTHNAWPPPGQGVSRLDSTASVSTTKAARGSPPPPETPASEYGTEPAGGIAARYAAAGIAGTSTLSNLQAQSMNVAQRQNQNQNQPQQPVPTFSPPPQQSVSPPPQQQTPARRWTPTEDPNNTPYGPIHTFQGAAGSVSGSASISSTAANPSGTLSNQPDPSSSVNQAQRVNALEHDMGHMNINDEPPPAYSSIPQSQQRTGYPAEKEAIVPGGSNRQNNTAAAAGVGVGVGAAAAGGAAAIAGAAPSLPSQATLQASKPTQTQAHPAFANDARPDQLGGAAQQGAGFQRTSSVTSQATATSTGSNRTSPPPLPEGWIAHLDPNTQQYYYIHLPTQSTQWEFPKGPTPLNLNNPPLSPTGTIVGNPLLSPMKPMLSPGFPPGRESMTSISTAIASPTAAGFTGLPPTAGVDLFKVAPANGVYFGPYLRYTNMDADSGIWFGSILIVTDGPHPPTIHIHQSVDLSPNPRQLKANLIYQHQKWLFYRYDIDLRMEEDHESKWTYAVTSHLGCTRYEFMVASRLDTSWRYVVHSGNDFALNVNPNERQRLGGLDFMWKDILQKHQEVGGFHCQLGLGNQIFADRMWKEVPALRQWTAMSGKDNRKNAVWTAAHEEDVTHAYFHYYTSHFDQPNLREAFAQIPHVLTLDDHDIFDGFGSYPEYMQFSNMFKNIGRVGTEMYLLFQHHTTLEILRNVNNDLDLFTITGTGWHFLKYLGPAVVVVGPDCRSERNPHQVMAGPTYQGLFPKVAVLPTNVQHCVWMLPVPIIYPRLEAAEQFANTFATGKKAVTGTFNALGKVTGSVAGIVGGKQFVNDGFSSIKKAVGKSGLMSNVLSPFGEIDLLDELRDQWTHDSKDLERTYLIRTLQGIAHSKSMRISFFSGAANCCGAGLLHDPSHPSDHKTMYQVITSSVVNAPPNNYTLKLLHPNSHSSANRPLYVPQNGHRSAPANANPVPTDTKEDMIEMFGQDVNGQPRDMRRLMGRRNYAVVVSYDPDVVQGAFGSASAMGTGAEGGLKQMQMAGRVSLAVDFFVQSDAGAMGGGYAPMGQAGTVKYGPLIIPGLEYGR